MSGSDWRNEKELLRRFVQKDVRHNARNAISRRLSLGDWTVFIGGEIIGIFLLSCLYSSGGDDGAPSSTIGALILYGIIPFCLLVVAPIRGVIAFRVARFRNHTEIDAIKRAGQWIHHRDD